MIHIIRNNQTRKWDVATLGYNYELLQRTVQGFDKIEGVYKHIRAMGLKWGTTSLVPVQDDATMKILYVYVDTYEVEITDLNPFPPYIPNRNYKPKKV